MNNINEYFNKNSFGHLWKYIEENGHLESTNKIKEHIQKTLVDRYPHLDYHIEIFGDSTFGVNITVVRYVGRFRRKVFIRRYNILRDSVRYFTKRKWFGYGVEFK
ncbi:MAG: hypothetical protein ACRC92_11400 [Peptostreptococcaceae bacterium]